MMPDSNKFWPMEYKNIKSYVSEVFYHLKSSGFPTEILAGIFKESRKNRISLKNQFEQ